MTRPGAAGAVARWLAVVTALGAALGLAPLPARALDATDAVRPPPRRCGPVEHPRPCVGLVLSGGGARGLAHVGVLKVLERERVPIDLIAGTSMGAIIGGLYAAGLSADTLERELLSLDWDAIFASRAPRETLSQRRREEDFEISPAVEVGLGADGWPMLPLGSVSSRGLELLLRRYTLGVRDIARFDALPIPFRAVATDMETGAPVVFDQGDLAQALRASMSVPGVFPPTDVNGRVLGDGGLVENLPVEVVRRLGAEVVIAVNIGTPLAPRSTLGTMLGLTSQMINILTEQNVQRSIAQLEPARDLLITPELGGLTAADFAQARQLVALGEAGAQTRQPRLQALTLDADGWQAHRSARLRPPEPAAPIASVRFEGADRSHPRRLIGSLASQPGQPFDIDRAEADSRLLATSGDYLHTDYRVEDLPAGTGLVFRLEEKPWGPHYFRLGLDMVSNFAGRGEFNLKLSHNGHWLDEAGAEWRNRLQIGSVPRWFTEVYRPLGSTGPDRLAGFIAASSDVERRRVDVYPTLAPSADAGDAALLRREGRAQWRTRLDVGQALGVRGEWRLGVTHLGQRITPEIVAGAGSTDAERVREWALRATWTLDQLDHVSFPRHGLRVRVSGEVGRRWVATGGASAASETFQRYETDANAVRSQGPHTLDGSVRWRRARAGSGLESGHYAIGGFLTLSGYQHDQLVGNETLFARAIYTHRLNQQPVLTRGFFAGASLEAGNAWAEPGAIRLSDLRPGGSVFLGADTGVGPLYLALTWAPRGSPGVYLQLGRP